MSKPQNNRLLRPETLTAVGIIAISAALLVPTFGMRAMSALLPAAMLIGLIGLSILLLLSDQRKAATNEEAKPMTQAPKRVAGAFLLVVAYALATDFVGFYASTVISIPLVAWVFGFRHPLGLAAATLVVVGSIWLIFDFGMSQEFPSGRLWEK
jgi:putative tricarboxylic transport membrane protein